MAGLGVLIQKMSLQSAGEIPGVKLSGISAGEISLGDKAIAQLTDRSAFLHLAFVNETSMPDFHIEGFTGNLFIRVYSGNPVIRFGDLRRVNAEIGLYAGGRIEIGSHTSINGLITGAYNSTVQIGNDCMLSHDIHMQPHNQHGIIDLNTEQLVENKRNIVLGDHVWIGRAVSILPGIKIGDGSIVGANSVITKDVPANSAVAGYPAKIVRENCTWSRSSTEIDADATAYLNQLDTSR